MVLVWVYYYFAAKRIVEVPFIPGTLATKSHDAILGAIGFKEHARDGEKVLWFFERITVPDWNRLEVHNAGSTTRTESQIRHLEEAGLSPVTKTLLETRGRHEDSRGYRLVTFQIRDSTAIARELLEMSKTDASMRTILRHPGVRIVREVDQVFDHETTEKLEAKTGASAKLAKARDTDIQLSFGAEQSSVVTISDGSVVSYRLALLCWGADGSLQLRLDQGEGCPTGLSETLPDTVEAVATREIGRPTVEPITKPECPSIAGWWIREIDGARLQLNQEDCTISADAFTGPFSHSFRGLFADDYFQYVVKRLDKASGCQTKMYGNIEVLDPDKIRVVVVATDGKCDLPANFWEDLIWRRDTTTEPADVKAPSTVQ